MLEQLSSPPSKPLHHPFRYCPAAPQPSSPPSIAPSPKSCKAPSGTYQEHRTQHRNHHTQKSPRTDFAPQFIPSQLPPFIVQRADVWIVDRREERPGSWIRHASGGLSLSAIFQRRQIGSTYNSTPAAMVLRVEAGIAVLKPPAVGKEISWIALSIMRYGSLVQYEESLLVIDRRDHDMTNIQPEDTKVPCSSSRLKPTNWGRSAEGGPLPYCCNEVNTGAAVTLFSHVGVARYLAIL